MAVNVSFNIFKYLKIFINSNLKYLFKFALFFKSLIQKDDDETKNVITDAIDRHNFYRQKHNVPPLKISSKVCNHILLLF